MWLADRLTQKENGARAHHLARMHAHKDASYSCCMRKAYIVACDKSLTTHSCCIKVLLTQQSSVESLHTGPKPTRLILRVVCCKRLMCITSVVAI